MIIARTCTKKTKCVQHFLKTVVTRHMSHQMEAKNRGKVAAATAAVNNHVKVNKSEHINRNESGEISAYLC